MPPLGISRPATTNDPAITIPTTDCFRLMSFLPRKVSAETPGPPVCRHSADDQVSAGLLLPYRCSSCVRLTPAGTPRFRATITSAKSNLNLEALSQFGD